MNVSCLHAYTVWNPIQRSTVATHFSGLTTTIAAAAARKKLKYKHLNAFRFFVFVVEKMSPHSQCITMLIKWFFVCSSIFATCVLALTLVSGVPFPISHACWTEQSTLTQWKMCIIFGMPKGTDETYSHSAAVLHNNVRKNNDQSTRNGNAVQKRIIWHGRE